MNLPRNGVVSTHGVGRHYSSIAGQVIPSVAFFTLSLIDTLQRSSHPIAIEQCLTVPKPPAAAAVGSEAVKRGRGRPKGSTNKPKTAVLNPELQHILSMTQQVLALVQQEIDLTHWVFRWSLWQCAKCTDGAAVRTTPCFQVAS